MEEKVIAEHTYQLPKPTNEEIQNIFELEGFPDIDPNIVRDYIEACLYKIYCETLFTKEQLDKLVDATNFSRYVNSAINYNGRLPTDEEYKKLKEEYEKLKETF